VAERLLSVDPTLKTVTGFDTVENKIVTGSISVKAHLSPDMQIEASVQELTIVPVCEGDGLVLAADVLANSLNYHFRNRAAGDLYRPLNSPAAIAGHPLATSLDAFEVWGADLVGDGVYRHPLAP
jgi:hypothetical protein